MAVTYGFYNSLNKDRMYNAEQMSSIFNGVITDGVFSTIGNTLTTVAGTGLQVIVKPGKAWFNGTWTLNDALLPLDIETADVSLGRIDAVILEVDSSASVRANSIKVLKGTASANPVKPTLTSTENVHQYALAYVTVAAGATSITTGNIEINVGKSTCPFVTSVLQQTNIDQLFEQWEAEFDAWFENVQSQLSGDVATNLQRQIDAVASDLEESKDAMFSVGDIKYSIRDSIGGNWLPCDGNAIDQDLYPDLYNLIKPNGVELGGTAAKIGKLDDWTVLGVCVTTAGVVLFFKDDVLYKWKDGVVASLEITYVNPKTQNGGYPTGQPCINSNSIYKIKHLIANNNTDYYYVKAGLTDAYILDKNGDIISHIIVAISAVVGIHDISIGPNGSIALATSPDLGNSNANMYIFYGKEIVDFSLREQTITALNSVQPDNLGNTYYVSMHADNENAYVTVYDDYRSNNYDYIVIYVIPLTGNGNNITSTTLQKTNSNPVRRAIVCNLDSNRLLLKYITNKTGFTIYNISEKTEESIPKAYIVNDSYIWETKQYLYALGDGLYKISKTDLSDECIESVSISKNATSACQFAITDGGSTRFIGSGAHMIYDTGFAGTPSIVSENSNAFVKAK